MAAIRSLASQSTASGFSSSVSVCHVGIQRLLRFLSTIFVVVDDDHVVVFLEKLPVNAEPTLPSPTITIFMKPIHAHRPVRSLKLHYSLRFPFVFQVCQRCLS